MTESTLQNPSDADFLEPQNFSVDACGLIEYTPQGRRRYAAIFGKNGIDLRDIKTLAQHKAAYLQCFDTALEMMLADAKTSDASLDLRYFAAILQDDTLNIERYKRMTATRKSLTVLPSDPQD